MLAEEDEGGRQASTRRGYLHDFEEGLDGLAVVGELLQQMGLHVRLAGEHGVLALVVAPADLDGVEVPVQLLELQLTLGDLVEGDTQQAVLVKLADVVKACRRGCSGETAPQFDGCVWKFMSG